MSAERATRITENMNTETRESMTILLEAAIDELSHLHAGEVFFFPDLYRGYEWKRIPMQSRLLLGRYFMDFAHGEAGQKLIGVLDRTARQQRYVKK
ncbi:MAG: single-stranded DNA-binding protein [Oscillospiraceae bacterium]|nr:single-stranded DNA-binding protein [Oscillospiraceae bacterium]